MEMLCVDYVVIGVNRVVWLGFPPQARRTFRTATAPPSEAASGGMSEQEPFVLLRRVHVTSLDTDNNALPRERRASACKHRTSPLKQLGEKISTQNLIALRL